MRKTNIYHLKFKRYVAFSPERPTSSDSVRVRPCGRLAVPYLCNVIKDEALYTYIYDYIYQLSLVN